MAKAHDIVGLRKPGFPNNGFDLSNAFVTQSARFGSLQIARQFAFAGQAYVMRISSFPRGLPHDAGRPTSESDEKK